MPRVAIYIMSVKKVAADGGGLWKPYSFSRKYIEYQSVQNK